MVFEDNTRPAAGEQGRDIKKNIHQWLLRQPNRRVLEEDFHARVGSLKEARRLLEDRDFVVFEYKGERWVTAQRTAGEAEQVRPAGQIESPQAIKQRRVQLLQDVLLWLSSRPDQMATVADYRAEFGAKNDADSILKDDALVIFDFQGSRWM